MSPSTRSGWRSAFSSDFPEKGQQDHGEEHPEAGGAEGPQPAPLVSHRGGDDQGRGQGADVDPHVEDVESRIPLGVARLVEVAHHHRDIRLEEAVADDQTDEAEHKEVEPGHPHQEETAGHEQPADGHRSAVAEVAVGDHPAEERREVDEGEVETVDLVALGARQTEAATFGIDGVEQQDADHRVEGEALPHFGKEQWEKPLRLSKRHSVSFGLVSISERRSGPMHPTSALERYEIVTGSQSNHAEQHRRRVARVPVGFAAWHETKKPNDSRSRRRCVAGSGFSPSVSSWCRSSSCPAQRVRSAPPKTFWLSSFCSSFRGLSIAGQLLRGRLDFRWSPLATVLLALPLIQAVSALWSASPRLALTASFHTAIWIVGALWIATATEKERLRLVDATALGAAISGVVLMAQAAGLAVFSLGPAGPSGRLNLTGLTGNPADLSMAAVLLLPLVLTACAGKTESRFRWIARDSPHRGGGRVADADRFCRSRARLDHVAHSTTIATALGHRDSNRDDSRRRGSVHRPGCEDPAPVPTPGTRRLVLSSLSAKRRLDRRG